MARTTKRAKAKKRIDDVVRRSRQKRVVKADADDGDEESETLQISRAVSAIMAAAAAADAETDTEADDNDVEDSSRAYSASASAAAYDDDNNEEEDDTTCCDDGDGTSCAYDDDDDDDEDNSSVSDGEEEDDDDDLSSAGRTFEDDHSDDDEDEKDEKDEKDKDTAKSQSSSASSSRHRRRSSSKLLGRRRRGKRDKENNTNRNCNLPNSTTGKKWGLKRLLGTKRANCDDDDDDDDHDDDLSSAYASASTGLTRSHSHVSSAVRDIDHTILLMANDTATATAGGGGGSIGRVSIVEDVSTAAGGAGSRDGGDGGGDEEASMVAFEVSTTFPTVSSFLSLGSRWLGYESTEEEGTDGDGDENGNQNRNGNQNGGNDCKTRNDTSNNLDVIDEEDEIDDSNQNNAPPSRPTSPPLSIAFSQSTPDRNNDPTQHSGPAPLTPSVRTASEFRRPMGSPEKIAIQREDSSILVLGEVPTPKRMPFKSLVGVRGSKTSSTPEVPAAASSAASNKRKQRRRDHVIVSVLSSDNGPPTSAPRSSASFGMCGALPTSSEGSSTTTTGAWYNCGVGGCHSNNTVSDADSILAALKEDEEEEQQQQQQQGEEGQEEAWTANFEEAFGSPDDGDNPEGNDLATTNPKAQDVQPTSSGESVPGTQGGILVHKTPSTSPSRRSKGLPRSPTSVILGDACKEEEEEEGQEATADDLKKQVTELNQHITKMSYDMRLLSSIVADQGQGQNTKPPTSTSTGGDATAPRRCLADDVIDDDVEDKDVAGEPNSSAADFSVEVRLELEEVPTEKPSIEPIVATASVPVSTTTADRADEIITKAYEKDATKTSPPSAPLFSKVFKSKKKRRVKKESKLSVLSKKSSPSSLRAKKSLFFRRSKSQASKDVDQTPKVPAAPSPAEIEAPPVPEKSETFGDVIVSTANALLDQAADYAFPPEEVEEEVAGEKKRSKAKKTQKKKEEKVKAKAKKGASKLNKNKSKGHSASRLSQKAKKKKDTSFSFYGDDRADRVCRLFEDCSDLYNDICSFREISCMCQDFVADAHDEATLAACRMDYAVKDSIRNFGEQVIALADTEGGENTRKKSRKSKSKRRQ